MGVPIGRLAPSPTGALHLGNARSFLLAWLSIRQQAGELRLRIEDIDSPRVKPWAVQATIDDLQWLGLDWDQGSELMVQSQRLDRYREVLDRLRSANVIYPCTCTRAEVAEAASAPHESSARLLEGPLYPGTCRTRRDEAALLLTGTEFAYRFRFADVDLQWRDGLHGPQQANPCRQLGDFVIARHTGVPAYQLAVVVDDHDQGITEIVRGDDLIASTYRQLAILDVLGWQPPSYVHVPLIVGPDGRRLAKRHGDTRVSQLRKQGVAPEALIGYLAWTLKLIEQPAAARPRELIGLLDWQRIPTEPHVFELEPIMQTFLHNSRDNQRPSSGVD